MNITPERNESCPCGSGKKFKKCCLLKNYEGEQIDSEFREFEENLNDKIFESLPVEDPAEFLREAHSEFLNVLDCEDEELDPDDPIEPLLFANFLLFHFPCDGVPEDECEALATAFTSGKLNYYNPSAGHLFLKLHRNNLNPDEVRFIEDQLSNHATFLQVLEHSALVTRVRDLYTQEELDVKVPQEFQNDIQLGNILTGTTARYKGRNFLSSLGGVVFKESVLEEIKESLADLRKEAKSREDLFDVHSSVLNLYIYHCFDADPA